MCNIVIYGIYLDFVSTNTVNTYTVSVHFKAFQYLVRPVIQIIEKDNKFRRSPRVRTNETRLFIQTYVFSPWESKWLQIREWGISTRVPSRHETGLPDTARDCSCDRGSPPEPRPPPCSPRPGCKQRPAPAPPGAAPAPPEPGLPPGSPPLAPGHRCRVGRWARLGF